MGGLKHVENPLLYASKAEILQYGLTPQVKNGKYDNMVKDFLDFINYEKRLNTMSLAELIAEGNRLIAQGQALDSKDRSKKLACQIRSKSIPKNATIRKEYVKCKKPNCYRKKHGPYYYAYWKDPITKKLKKKYIGRNYVSDDEQKDQHRK
jgi:hypothetical protein